MTFEPGDVVVIAMRGTDGSAGRARPALVISSRPFHHTADMVVCGITTSLRDTSFSVAIDPNDMGEPRLLRPSRIKVSKLATLEQSVVKRRLGRVKPAILQAVRKELRALLGL